MMRFPEEHFTVAVLGNCSNVNARRLAQQVADLYLFDPEGDVQESSRPETIELSEPQISAKAGRYFDPDSITFIDIEFTNDRLQLWGFDLLPIDEESFLFAAFPEATVEFQFNSGKEPSSVLVDTGTTKNHYTRVEPAMLTTAPLSDYPGNYHSSELDVTWKILQIGDALEVYRRRQGSSTLKPSITDVFTDDWIGSILHGASKPTALAFDRDEHSQVTGFRISDAGARVCNLRFERTGRS
jgi:hypothetical protein